MSRLDDRLDQAIDDVLAGRDPDRPGAGGLVPTELLPLLAAAEELAGAADLAELRLDPGLARDHLALALREAPARPVAPARRVLAGWRRRVALTAVAAVLATVPAVAASASSLPGDPLYPVKQAVDRVKLLTARSPEQTAATRVALAAERLDELQRLLAGGPPDQVAPAAARLRRAIDAAGAALLVARGEGVDSTTLAALESRLRAITARAAELAARPTPSQAGTMTTRVPAEALLPLTSLPPATPTSTTGVASPTTTLPAVPTTTGPPTAPLPPPVPGVLGTPQSTTTTTTAPPPEPKKKKKKPKHGHGGGGPAATTTTATG